MKTRNKKRCAKKVITSDQLAIRELRLKQDLTLKEAGEKLGLSSKGIGAIENGRTALPKERIEQIVKAYGLSYLDFIRAKRIIDKEGIKKRKRQFTRRVLTNSDRRSYQKIITKECKVLRSMRRMKKISQDEASRLCGYSRPTIGHIENGRIELSKERIKHIVESYGYQFESFHVNLNRTHLRDDIVDSCVIIIEQLDDSQLYLFKELLKNFKV